MPETERHAFLLGAGASADADVPMSTGLTEAIAEKVARSRTTAPLRGTAQALNLAIGALIAYDTARGPSAYKGIDVERLLSAVQMLAKRDSLDEITPFVAAWSPALDSLGSDARFPPFFKNKFAKALTDDRAFEFDNLFKDAVRGGAREDG